MIRVTRWSPDTCGCILEYEWDDGQNENARAHTFKRVVKACPDHQALTGKPLFDQVVSENSRKNITFGEIQKAHPQMTLDNYLWSFDKDRVLQVSGMDLPQPAKQGLQVALNARFGTGKVRIA